MGPVVVEGGVGVKGDPEASAEPDRLPSVAKEFEEAGSASASRVEEDARTGKRRVNPIRASWRKVLNLDTVVGWTSADGNEKSQ